MRRMLGMALVVSTTLVAAAAGPAAGAPDEPRRYVVDQVRASWAIPQEREGRYRMYWIEAARYEDLGSGEVRHFARAERMECKGDASGLTCSSDMGPWKEARGKPGEFFLAQDLSAASVAFESRGVEHRAQWTAFGATEDPFEFLPGTYERSEGCGSRSGAGYGLHRSMKVVGTVFGRDLTEETERGIVGVARYVLETECDPEDWWRGAAPVPGTPPQWLRNAETSSPLSMLERPSIPTSLAFS